MSRVGKKPIQIPAGVTVKLDLPSVTVKGPKGTVTKALPAVCRIVQEGDAIVVTRPNDDKSVRATHGTTRALLASMVRGVTDGFSKHLEIVGVGYKAEIKGKTLVLVVGYSNPVNYAVPDGVTIETTEPTKIRVSGIDRQKVGQVAAEIRAIRPPEPYKGKGIKYADEVIHKKAGKTAVVGT